ncbi:MAG: YafY family transcriptional regulator [Bacteroidales bacterium]|nr:YafY family transcriptional regulator [Bacteroidales bacterium]MBN2818869.1 YafY family transcriptional regulator [Bacteroidales bacterium]
MNRIDRLSAILILLQTRKIIKAEQIAERFDISLRTVYRDMKALYEAGIPIGAEAGIGYYLVEGFHLPPIMFSAEEAGAMLVAGKLVNSFSDVSVKKHFNLAIDKVKSVLPEQQKNFISGIENQIEVLHKTSKSDKIFSNNFTSDIQKALAEDSCMEITYYANSKSETTTRIIEPLGLYFYSFSWHLIAFCKLRNDYRDFRIDRIKELQIVNEKCCAKKQSFSINEFFENQFKNEFLNNVTVVFHKETAGYISSVRYYYGFYEEKITDNTVEMKFASNDLNYMANWLITLGTMVKDIQSFELTQKIVSIVKSLNTKYLK